MEKLDWQGIKQRKLNNIKGYIGLERIELEDFTLEVFDYDNINHRFVTVVLDNDDDFHDYVGETQYLIESAKIKEKKGKRDRVYVVKHEEKYLGIICLIILDDKPYFAIAIIPGMRRQHYGYNLLREYIDYLFNEYHDYDTVFASVYPKNKASINNVLKLGLNNFQRLIMPKKDYRTCEDNYVLISLSVI